MSCIMHIYVNTQQAHSISVPHSHALQTSDIAGAAISQEQTRWEESRWLSFASSWPSALGSSSSFAVTISSADLAMSRRQEWGGKETSLWLLKLCVPVKWWPRIKILQVNDSPGRKRCFNSCCISPLPTLLSSTEFIAGKASDRLNCKLKEFSLRPRTVCTALLQLMVCTVKATWNIYTHLALCQVFNQRLNLVQLIVTLSKTNHRFIAEIVIKGQGVTLMGPKNPPPQRSTLKTKETEWFRYWNHTWHQAVHLQLC